MKRSEKRGLWHRGAKAALKTLKNQNGPPLNKDIKGEAIALLSEIGMTYVVKDDYWARGFVAMLKRQADVKDEYYLGRK